MSFLERYISLVHHMDYWPDDKTFKWMAEKGMKSYEMTEIHHRGMKAVLDESFAILTDQCDGVFLSSGQ